MSRTFPQLHQQITSSSDFIKAKKDAATFKTTAVNQNSKEYQDYDNNFIVSKDGNGCLISARSYNDYLSISKGKHYINPILSGASAGKYQSWMGAFLTFNQRDVSNSAPAVQDLSYVSNTILNTAGKNKIPYPPTSVEGQPADRALSDYPGYIEDPKLQFFYEKCKSTDNDLPRYITNFSELKSRERASNDYWRAVAGQNMTGFSYPNKPNLSIQLTDLTNAPYAPIASIDASLNAIKQSERFCGGNENFLNSDFSTFEEIFTFSLSAPELTLGSPGTQFTGKSLKKIDGLDVFYIGIPENTTDLVTITLQTAIIDTSTGISYNSTQIQNVQWSLSGANGFTDNSSFFNLDASGSSVILTVKNNPSSNPSYNPGYNGLNHEDNISNQISSYSNTYIIKINALDTTTNKSDSCIIEIEINNVPTSAGTTSYADSDLKVTGGVYNRNFGTMILDNISYSDAKNFIKNGYFTGGFTVDEIDVNEYLQGPTNDLIYKSWTWAGYTGLNGTLFVSTDTLYIIPGRPSKIGLVNRLNINRDFSVSSNNGYYSSGSQAPSTFPDSPNIDYSTDGQVNPAWANMYPSPPPVGSTISIESGENPFYSKNILTNNNGTVSGSYPWPETSLMLIACTWWGKSIVNPPVATQYVSGGNNWSFVPVGLDPSTSLLQSACIGLYPGPSTNTLELPKSLYASTTSGNNEQCIYYIRGLDLSTALNWIRNQQATPSDPNDTLYANIKALTPANPASLGVNEHSASSGGVQVALDKFKEKLPDAKSFLWTEANDANYTTELWLLNVDLYNGISSGDLTGTKPSSSLTPASLGNTEGGLGTDNNRNFRNIPPRYGAVGSNGFPAITGYKRMIAGVNPGYYILN